MARSGARHSGSNRVYADASKLFRVLSSVPAKSALASFGNLDARRMYRDRFRDHASQSRAIGPAARFRRFLSAHSTGHLLRLDIRVCREPPETSPDFRNDLTSPSDWNIRCDPHAYRRMLGSDLRVSQIGVPCRVRRLIAPTTS